MYGLIRMSEVFEQKRAANSERKYLWGRGGGGGSNKRSEILYTFCCHEFVTQSLHHLL